MNNENVKDGGITAYKPNAVSDIIYKQGYVILEFKLVL